jgi:hypothetical protein
MAKTTLTWETLVSIMNSAGVIVVDERTPVYPEASDPETYGLKTFHDELYCLIHKRDNTEVDADGACAWVVSHTGGEPMMMAFYRTWVVADDLTLKQEQDKRDGDARRAYENQFVRGAKFRIVKAGANISGMVPIAPYTQQGFREGLAVGTVLQCAGSSMTSGDGIPAIKWLREDGKSICNDAVFSHVQGGMWSGQYPAPGWMELIPVEVPAV